jgi:ligand-binding sensor domain-containing protein
MKKITLALITILGISQVYSQAPNWIVYNAENSGLPNNWVPCIEIDSEGNKWIGTVYGGVAKFDNSAWQVFNVDNSGLAAHNIQAIHIDSLDNKWFGSGWTGRISKYDGSNWTVYDSANTEGILIDLVGTRDIITDKFGNLLIGTQTIGIKSFNGTDWSSAPISGIFIYDLALDQDQNLWVGHWNDGATFFDGENSTNYTSLNSILPSDDVTSIAVEDDGTVWLATRYDGIVRFDQQDGWTLYNNSNATLPSNSFNTVVIDNDGNKWFATGNGSTGWGDGIVKYDDENWVAFDTSNSGIPSNDVISLAVDGNNNLWMGTQQNGVGVFNENGIILSTPESLTFGKDLSIFPNPFSSHFKIRLNMTAVDELSLMIYDSMGQIVINQTIRAASDFHIVDSSQIESGLYFATFTNTAGEVAIKKIVKK